MKNISASSTQVNKRIIYLKIHAKPQRYKGAKKTIYQYTVFTYHNGAESYYAARGFRSKLCI